MANENMLPEKKDMPDLSMDGPRGVGGWLAFLIVVLTILSPLANIGMLAKEYSDMEKENPLLLFAAPYVQYKWFSWGVVLVAAAISIAAGCLLWKKLEWKSVRFAIGALWVIGPLSIILVGVYFFMIFGTEMMNEFLKDAFGTLAKSVFWAAVWTAYLLKSRRVRNTYVRETP